MGASHCSFASYSPGMASDAEKLAAPLEPESTKPGEKYFQVTKEVKLYYEKTGTGSPLLFIHGGPGIPTRSQGGLLRLKGHELYIYHARGTGLSTRPIKNFQESSWPKNPPRLEKALGMSAQLADIERIRRIITAEEKTKKINIIGLSYGGLIATLYASEFPKSVNKLVLVNPVPLRFSGEDSESNLYKLIGREQTDPNQKAAFKKYMAKFGAIFGKLWEQDEQSLRKLRWEMGPYYARVMKKRGLKMPAEIPPDWQGGWSAFALFLSVGQKYDFTDFVKENARANTLIILGGKDLTPVKAHAPFREALRESRQLVMPDSGHFPFVDQPAEFAKIVLEFLDK